MSAAGEDYDPRRNGFDCWALGIACQRAALRAGRQLTPHEMLEAVDREQERGDCEEAA